MKTAEFSSTSSSSMSNNGRLHGASPFSIVLNCKDFVLLQPDSWRRLTAAATQAAGCSTAVPGSEQQPRPQHAHAHALAAAWRRQHSPIRAAATRGGAAAATVATAMPIRQRPCDCGSGSACPPGGSATASLTPPMARRGGSARGTRQRPNLRRAVVVLLEACGGGSRPSARGGSSEQPADLRHRWRSKRACALVACGGGCFCIACLSSQPRQGAAASRGCTDAPAAATRMRRRRPAAPCSPWLKGTAAVRVLG